MRLTALVQARMSSGRLPGKVLREVADRPVLAYVLERVERSSAVGEIVVVTSSEPEDDAIVAFCVGRGVPCHRGPLRDVAARFAGAIERFALPAFMRVNADSPLLDPLVLDRVAAAFRDGAVDLATNVFPRSFPRGQSVEILTADAFRRGLRLMRDDDDREHVTPVFYRHPDAFEIRNVASDHDRASLRLVVDTAEDLELFAQIISCMDRPHWEYDLASVLQMHALVMSAAHGQ